ncbi:MAG: imidazolonepropionase-like amidohydrolase, partial [Planctomycetota bacterium]
MTLNYKRYTRMVGLFLLPLAAACAAPLASAAGIPDESSTGNLAVRAERLHTGTGVVIDDGVVIIRAGKIVAIGPAAETPVPAGMQTQQAAVVFPGLVDAHSVVGIAGYLNQPHDQDQLEDSAPLQPELRALDAYNAREPLIEWVRSFGVTTLHTGHGPGSVISGETM